MDLLRITGCSMLILFASIAVKCQARRTKNIVLITLDGLRWQEVFKGADPSISGNTRYVKFPEKIESFTHSATNESRQSLMPFFWNVVADAGQLYGNRDFKNKVNCKNNHLISYPGYNEMLVGFQGTVKSNRKVTNPDATVFESIQKYPEYKNEVAAFATWDVFPYILRESRSDIHVNAGRELARGKISRQEKKLNHIQETQPRSDSLTFHYAMEYLKRKRPRVTFIGFDETDQHAHAGRYGEYLEAAHRADLMIAELWMWLQSQHDYRNQTTLFITTDHGRGSGKHNWRKHALLAAGSRHIWFAVIGPDTPSFGEMKIEVTTYQNQVAKTIAAFLGLPYGNEQPVGEVVQTMIADATPPHTVN